MSKLKSAITLSVAFMLLGCADGTTINTVTVRGKVLLDGKPLATGKVTFDAADGTTPSIYDVKDGSFEGKSTVGLKVARVASYKLVDMPKPNGMSGPLYDKQIEQNVIPDRYSVKSTLKAEVTAGGPNAFSFDVTSK